MTNPHHHHHHHHHDHHRNVIALSLLLLSILLLASSVTADQITEVKAVKQNEYISLLIKSPEAGYVVDIALAAKCNYISTTPDTPCRFYFMDGENFSKFEQKKRDFKYIVKGNLEVWTYKEEDVEYSPQDYYMVGQNAGKETLTFTLTVSRGEQKVEPDEGGMWILIVFLVPAILLVSVVAVLFSFVIAHIVITRRRRAKESKAAGSNYERFDQSGPQYGKELGQYEAPPLPLAERPPTPEVTSVPPHLVTGIDTLTGEVIQPPPRDHAANSTYA